MLVWLLTILFISVSKCQNGVTPYNLMNIKEMDNLAQFDDAHHRGPSWYDYSKHSGESASSLESEASSSFDFSSYSEASAAESSSGSSKETNERKRATKMYRDCTPCPHDMLKKYTNIGIKWLCAGYQRARRSFKSECMMRYRNCQDGTMFVKLYEQKCKNDPYHGRSWFYNYRV